MLSKEFTIALLIGCLLKETWSRTISISFNLNLDLAKNEHSKLSADMVQDCMKRTEGAMDELTRFRLGLKSNSSPLGRTVSEEENMLTTTEDEEAENKENGVDYSNASPIVIREKYQEPIQCFAHCLYEKMGVNKDGVFMQSEIQRKLYAIMLSEQVQLPECMDMDTGNKCEDAFKLHLCYSKLKMLESESRIKALVDQMTETDDNTLKNAADYLNATDDESEEEAKQNEIPSY